MKTLGERLRWARLTAGLNQYQLADRVRAMGRPAAQGQISQIETDIRRPRRATVESLAQACDVSPEYLLGRTQPAPMDDALMSEINDIVISAQSLAIRLAIVGERAKKREVGA